MAAMEEIAEGERIREYVVEGLTAANNWTELCRGISVGHKRIQRFSSIEVSKIRLRTIQSVAEPRVQSLAAYNVGTGDGAR